MVQVEFYHSYEDAKTGLEAHSNHNLRSYLLSNHNAADLVCLVELYKKDDKKYYFNAEFLLGVYNGQGNGVKGVYMPIGLVTKVKNYISSQGPFKDVVFYTVNELMDVTTGSNQSKHPLSQKDVELFEKLY